ncbi:hypothetical protein PUN28_014325 [Cardiocondyla obscurior]|uniref:CUB domain-containing protein n=1 Tax=Cardiocondyla obscurior TaxID=286306 RepID=A0AAW2F170_9HYME
MPRYPQTDVRCTYSVASHAVTQRFLYLAASIRDGTDCTCVPQGEREMNERQWSENNPGVFPRTRTAFALPVCEMHSRGCTGGSRLPCPRAQTHKCQWTVHEEREPYCSFLVVVVAEQLFPYDSRCRGKRRRRQRRRAAGGVGDETKILVT